MERLLESRVDLTSRLCELPYSISLYIQRALNHEALEYPDLAGGDAYKALMLYDELEGGEFEDEVRNSLALEQPDVMWHQMFPKMQDLDPSMDMREPGDISSRLAIQSYLILVQSLISCGDKEAALRFARQGSKAFPESKALEDSFDQLSSSHLADTNGGRPSVPDGETSKATATPMCVRREIYPWNDYEPDRFSNETLDFLNGELQKYAPKCQILATDLPVLSKEGTISSQANVLQAGPSHIKQLGMFANEHVSPGEVILLEPSVLTASSRQLDLVCDACSAALPKLSAGVNISCPSCSDIYFCSTICQERALELYHPAVCGTDDFDIVAKDPPLKSATDALYVLLLARVFAMAETQELHPLDLPHTKYLWGDFSHDVDTKSCSLPFRFDTNIAQPLQILMNMGLDIFSPANLQRYDVWVMNTLLAKFRGVASARFNQRTLRPDVAAVHPLWCLANHSCSPNVRWEWSAEEGAFQGKEKGAMGYAARNEDELVTWGNKNREAGIKKGEELLNHYCDIAMTVKERREWAAGALGGMCVCDRCTWEAGED